MTTREPGFNCKDGSAWHTWQIAGANWRKKNPDATIEQARAAATEFSAATSDNEQSAKYYAFMECAR